MKRSAGDLALLGGEPEFASPLHVGRPFMPDRRRFLQLVEDALDRRWLSNHGPLVRELEERLGEYLGTPCALVCNGTMGLQLSVRALGIRGSAVCPSFTFAATPHALKFQGVEPVFCDVARDDHMIDSADAERRFDDDVGALVGVHLWGAVADVDRLVRLAVASKKKILFDAAHAFGSTHAGQPIARFGDATIFSFHATKSFSTFEGGAVASVDVALLQEIRLLRDFGFVGLDRVEGVGINAKMNEISAAAGLAALSEHARVLEAYRERFEAYEHALAGRVGLSVLDSRRNGSGNAQYVVVTVDQKTTGLHRDTLMKTLHAEGVFARRYFYPGCHRLLPYASQTRTASLPVTEWLVERVLVLPTGPAVAVDEIRRVTEVIAFAFDNAALLEEAARRVDVDLSRFGA
jgi:dTDP-4-amino-4,6-dideoxygalactose transaminase